MNTIRFCFTATVVFLVVAIGVRVASCEDNAVPFWKCCPFGRLYDPKVRYCRLVRTEVEEYRQRLVNRLKDGFRMAADATLNFTYNYPPYCNTTQVLVDVPAEEMHELMKANPSPIELSPFYCFDLTPSDELVAQTCRPRDQYCGRPGYTCVNKCCDAGRMNFNDPNNKDWLPCERNEMPFTLSVYETDAGGSPVGQSNNTVLPIYGGLSCATDFMMNEMFMLTTDGKLHFNTIFSEWIIPETEYCLEYYSEDGSPEATKLTASVCTNATPRPAGFAFWVIFPSSVVCLVLTLIVYAILPYLRNAHGYYVMFYMACQLVYFICITIDRTVKLDIDSPLCIPFGYFNLFATLTTCCWLNVICFDIYWILRYNNSTNRRNTSKSVRTIMYHIYCWGFPSIIVSTGYLFQHSHSEALREVAPDIGEFRCDFGEYKSYATFIFNFLPTCGMLTANLILFILTASHCSRIKSELNNFQQTVSKTQIFLIYKERFVMSIKLFLVFGIPFLFSKLCVLFQIERWMTIWGIIDRIYYLQGVYIFMIFVAKPKVIMEIRKKFRRSTVQSELIQLNNTTGTS